VSATAQPGSPHGVLGVFFVLLGAGLIFDADWNWRGGTVIALGVLCLVIASRRAVEEHDR
jgi:hypothetical protein